MCSGSHELLWQVTGYIVPPVDQGVHNVLLGSHELLGAQCPHTSTVCAICARPRRPNEPRRATGCRRRYEARQDVTPSTGCRSLDRGRLLARLLLLAGTVIITLVTEAEVAQRPLAEILGAN